MKERIKRWLLTLGLWLARLGGASEALTLAARFPRDALDLRDEAKKICGFIETSSAEGTSGEWKRHRALAAIKKTHPGHATRDIALAIELVMSLVKGAA